MATQTIESVSEFLSKCSASELIKVLTPRLSSSWKEQRGIRSGLVLCEFYKLATPVVGDANKWSFELIGKPAYETEWSFSEEQDYWESGDCPKCEFEVSSCAKKAICPLCGERVELT